MNVIIVDNNDNEISVKPRKELSHGDIYRVTGLWVMNSKGEMLLAQRSFTKKSSPGRWSPAVMGTVEEGETYDSNVVKEAREELGLEVKIGDLTKGKKVFSDISHPYFLQWYSIVSDKRAEEFVLQGDEVEAVRWFSKEELADTLEHESEKFLVRFEERLEQAGIDYAN